MAKAASASIIIPVFNQAALTRQCLDALVGRETAEIIVVNDASTDGTAKMLATYGARIKVVTHQANTGFARTCNDGAKIATGKYLVFLNNDTVPQAGWLAALVRHAEKHPKASVVGAKLLYPNDTIQHAGVIICQDGYPRHIYTGFPADHPGVSKSRRFQAVTAAAMLVRRKAFTAVRGFDTKFRNGFEDVDLCLRLGQRGHEVHYCADSVVQHLESVSPGRFKHDRHNVALYRKRWLGKVVPDDVSSFLADGLLGLEYEGSFPLRLKVAPALAIVDAGRKEALENELAAKARQIADLTREVTKLRAELGASNPAAAALQLDRERERFRAQVRRATPEGARILVVSKGDSALLAIPGRHVEHFPQAISGTYLGYHPADSADAIAHLETLHGRGAEYLAIPGTSAWWLKHYKDFAKRLRRTSKAIPCGTEAVVFALRPRGTK